jgi:adenylate cyclase
MPMSRRSGGSRFAFRVGVNLGDVVIDGDDIQGDGVNVAARLEGLAQPGGVCISGGVYEQVRDRIDIVFEDLGEQNVKNIDRPVRAWHWAPTIAAVSKTPEAPLTLPDKPSIAVLPFNNMSGDPEQEYFSDGISEDIITALSKFKWFFVTARNSTFTYKGSAVDIKEVGRDLGVRYVLEGSVRKGGDRVRVTVQLIDATTGNHLWAERYDRQITDVFALQDEITETVTATIAPQLMVAENERVKGKPPESLAAWELVIRFQPLFWRMNHTDLLEAQKLLRGAIEHDPDYAQAHALLGFSYIWHAWMGWGDDPRSLIPKAEPEARRALELDDQEPWAYMAMSAVHGYARRHEESVRDLRRALDLNPNFSFGYAWLGTLLGYAGKVDEANEMIDQAYRISPKDPFNSMLPGLRAIGLFTASRDAEALEHARESLRMRPDWIGVWRLYTTCAAQLGDMEEARQGLAEVKRLQPTISLEWAEKYAPWVRQQDRDRYVEAFRLAGLE